MDRTRKSEKINRKWGGQSESPWLYAVSWGIGAFVLTAFLLSLAVTGLAYVQRDPTPFVRLGRACPFVAALVAGAFGGKRMTDRPWLGGLCVGAISSLLLWLLSAGVTGEMSALGRLLAHVAVAATSVIGALLPVLFERPAHKRRRHRGYASTRTRRGG